MHWNSRSLWLSATLLILLTALGATLWLDAEHPVQVQASVIFHPKLPPVVYEDTQHLSTLKTVDEVHKGEQTTDLSPHPGVALILDDVGYNLAELKRALQLPYPIAISIIPNAPYAVRAAKMAHAAGHVVMLHLPMEPANPMYRSRMDGAFLRSGMSREDVRRIMLADLAKIPYVEGVNNHMGSRLTSLAEPMHWVMDVCRERGLFFVDSRTSKDSVAAKIAESEGLRWGERRVFLDNSLKEKDLEASWQIAERKRPHRTPVIVIAHPHDATLNFLAMHVKANDMHSIIPLKKILYAGHTTHMVAREMLDKPLTESMHAKSNIN